ncbi:MAG TPA: DUF1850 domain-containing protein [Casimicrobiaceae bacterium]|nr:DUF1850 domain-containing protein [Casimicrobiaceae bacterium]
MARRAKPQPGAPPTQGRRQRVLSAICILAAGVLRASLPASEFTLAWQHSVEKTRWEERYAARDGRLVLRQARIQGLGAGMEPPAGARFADGWWTWRPNVKPLSELRLTRSDYTSDYTICWKNRCATLGALAGPTRDGDVVTLTPCSP